jgi:hypothetical protein
MAVVIGLDNWVCAAAGSGSQNSYTEIFCVDPSNPSTTKFIDVYKKTINGVPQSDPNWPTSIAGQVIGVHDISGGTGASWLEVTFHQASWGGDGGAVLNLATNTWSLVTQADVYWSGHVSMGNGKYANSSGSVNGKDSRGLVLRDPNDLMNSGKYLFSSQPPDTLNNWCDADHSSWLNSVNNPNAPVLISRYTAASSCSFAWTGEIIAAAVDGSNTVWRFAHNHNQGSSCYYAQSFAQISNDGTWALFSSSWDGTLGSDTSFGCSTRIDTFIVELSSGANSSANSPATTTSTGGSTNSSGGTANTSGATTPAASGGGSTPTGTTSSSAAAATNTTTTTRTEQESSSVSFSGNWYDDSLAPFSGGSAREAMDPGASATFTFTGSAVRWIGYRDEWSGIATVYLDGQLQATVDTYATPSQAQTIVWSATALGAGSHTLTIKATGTHDASSLGSWIWVDAFDVDTIAAAGTSSAVTASTAAATTTGGPAANTVTRIEQDNSAVSHAGNWFVKNLATASAGSAWMAMDAGSTVTLSFTGTAVSWIGYQDAWSGIAKVSVDGSAVGQVDTYSATDKAKSAVYTLTGLSQGNHELTIEVTGTKDGSSAGSWVWVDAFDVTP